MHHCELPVRNGGTENNETAETASIRSAMTLSEHTNNTQITAVEDILVFTVQIVFGPNTVSYCGRDYLSQFFVSRIFTLRKHLSHKGDLAMMAPV